MANSFYTHSSYPATGAAGASASMRAELDLVTAGFDKLPALTANTAIVANAGGTALTNTVGTLALAGNFAITGAFATTLVAGAAVSITLPIVSGLTLATLTGTETLTNKTLVAPALGTPASGVLTNATGTAAGLTAGNVTTNANLTGHVTSTGNAAVLGSFTRAQLNTAISDDNLGITLATEQASTSGTAIDFTGIPAGVKRITVMVMGVSTNSTSPLMVQLGDSGGIEISGYSGSVTNESDAAFVAYTSGFLGVSAMVAANTYSGTFILSLENSSTFTWASFSGVNAEQATIRAHNGRGRKSLSAELDRVRITTVNGTDTFDAGAINISYE